MNIYPKDVPKEPRSYFSAPTTHVYHFVDADKNIVASFKRQKGIKDVVVAKDVQPADYYRTTDPNRINGFYQQVCQALTKAGDVSLFPVPVGARYFVSALFVNEVNVLGEIVYLFDLDHAAPEMNWLPATIEGYIVSMPPFLGIRPPFYQNGASE